MASDPRASSSTTNVKRSSPVPIAGAGHHAHARSRSDSTATGYSSSSSDGSPVRTPPRPALSMAIPHVAPPSAGTSPTSPFFSLLRATTGTSPGAPAQTAKGPLGYPFGARGALSALDDETPATSETPIAKHARRASLAGTLPARFPPAATSTSPPTSVMQNERGVGVLRRLSLGGAFGRPQIPVKPPTPPARTSSPPSVFGSSAPTTSIPEDTPVTRAPRTKRRSATLSADRPPRAPSPMGERILKGQFDSFH